MLPSVALALVAPSDLAALPQDVLAELARLLAPCLPSEGGVEWLGTADAARHLEYSVSTFEKHYREWGIPFYQDAPSSASLGWWSSEWTIGRQFSATHGAVPVPAGQERLEFPDDPEEGQAAALS